MRTNPFTTVKELKDSLNGFSDDARVVITRKTKTSQDLEISLGIHFIIIGLVTPFWTWHHSEIYSGIISSAIIGSILLFGIYSVVKNLRKDYAFIISDSIEF